MLAPLGLAVAPAITLAALASQMSAPRSPTSTARAGLLAEFPARWLTEKAGYLLTLAAALFVTWTSNIYEIIVYASKAFVIYYGLQSLQACLIAARGAPRRWPQALVFASACAVSVLIVFVAVPAEV